MSQEIQLQTSNTNTNISSSRSKSPAAGAPKSSAGSPVTSMGVISSTADPSQESILPNSKFHNSRNNHKKKNNRKSDKLTLIPLIFLIYFEVSGGPYGAEPAVEAAGPLLALLGFLIFPFIWSVPEALITAELATALPGNGGFVLWADRAFGPLAGSLMGTWKFLSGVINNAAYPVLCADYLGRAIPALKNSGGPRDASIIGFTVGLSFLNYTGLTIVGYAAMVLGIVSLLPFILLSLIAIPKIRPKRWGTVNGEHKDWRLYFNTLFWNLNFWDNASTMAGEVAQPQRTFPKALLTAVLMTCIGYLVPLLAGTGALAVAQDQWGDGFFADAAGILAGKWLKYWIEVGAVLSAIGLYEAQLSSGAYQLLGMADLGILPKSFGVRSKWFNTPWFGILVSSVITLAISFMSFSDIIASANFLYSLGMLLEFSSFLWLRKKMPSLKRPYRVPVRLPGLICMCLVPTVFLIYIMVIGTWKVWVIGIGLTIFAIVLYHFLRFCKAKDYLEFSNGEDILLEEEEDDDDKEDVT